MYANLGDYSTVGTSWLQRVTIAFWAIGVCPEIALGDGNAAENHFLRQVMRCGPNSLFVFLIMSGHPEVTLEQCDNLPISHEGTSLLAMREAAQTFHVDTEIRHFRPEDVDLLILPAIGQFRRSGTLGESHFMVIYRVNAERMYVIEGITGERLSFNRSRLSDFWTGIAMSEKQSTGIQAIYGWPTLAMFLVVTDIVVGVCLVRWLVRTKIVRSIENGPKVPP